MINTRNKKPDLNTVYLPVNRELTDSARSFERLQGTESNHCMSACTQWLIEKIHAFYRCHETTSHQTKGTAQQGVN